MKILIPLLLIVSVLLGQDSTKSEAFKRDLPKGKSTLHQPKYPSYPLLTGFLLQQEANSGDPFAQHELGIRLLLGNGFAPDTSKAIFWIQKAASQNISAAQFNLAIMYYNGIGVEWNPFLAYLNFKASADAGMAEGQFAFGIFFTENFVVNKDLSNAYRWFKKAADKDYEPARESIAYLIKQGYNPVDIENDGKNSNEEEKESTQSSSLMHQDWEVSFFEFEEDTLTDEQEKEIVEELFTKNKDELKQKLGVSEIRNEELIKDTSSLGIINFAADNGSPEALYISAKAAEMGIVVENNLIDAAFKYLRSYRLGSQKAAFRLYQLTREREIFRLLKGQVDKDNPDAMYTWAGLVALGFDNSLTDKQAYELLVKAVAQNHINSMIEIGLNYFNGSLVEKDKEKAFEYWEKASNLGSREADVRIAFAKISETKENYSDEINTLRLAANQGSVLAQSALAYCYENGIGVKIRKSMAAKLYRQAASRGNENAYNSLKRMYDELRPALEEFQIYKEKSL
ncbi:MAG: tetratricopeptide repeat protein [Melioribacteraceae bacterium]|nr:MAG: tetratricopeptide repeat protein [Melioribacteraceae bacterium]